MRAGEIYDIIPYGTETLGALRIEKGHVTGAELDGRTTLGDVGMAGMANPKKDFIGRVLMNREGLVDPQRPVLTGFKSVDPRQPLQAGAILLDSPTAEAGGVIKSKSALLGVSSIMGGSRLQMHEVVGRGLWQIDAWAESEARVRALLAELSGFALSDQAGAAVADDERRLMWAGPAKFWWAAQPDCGVSQQLIEQLSTDDGHVLDIGHSRTVIRLQGSAAQAVLQSGIAVDLDEEVFQPGQVVLSGLAHHTPVTLHRLEDECFELYVARSYARHTLEWLMATAKPYAFTWRASQ